MNDAAPAREYHALTCHGPDRFGAREDARLVAGYSPMDPARRPPQFKTYPGAASEPVPPALAELLFLSAGVVRVLDHPAVGRLWFRAAGSAGNLSPLEVYVVHERRVLHYEPVEHAVTPLGPAAEGPTTVVVTGVPWRTAWKYRERGFRHLYWDAGTMLSHVVALAPSGRLHLGFVDREVTQLVGADGVHEFPLAAVVLGEGEPPLSPMAGAPTSGFLAHRPLEFPLVTATQRAGDLAGRDDVERWRVAEPSPPAPSDVTFGQPVEDVVRRRGSTREFDRSATAPSPLLRPALAAATAPLGADFTAPGATLLEHEVLVHAVEGVVPGAYRWRQGGLELLEPRSDTRRLGRALCLDQDLGGDGALTVFHACDLDPVLDRLGSRGYRAALLEAGVVEGRLHLAAFALGHGATGLTFFDQDVRTAFATTAWPMLVTALGRPTYRARPGGGPGRPARLRGTR